MKTMTEGGQVLNFNNIKVLYMEDDAFTREKLLRILERRFTKVFVASDGEKGYQLYQKHKPDLIIADIKMGQENGLEMIKKIRELSRYTQIIITTAYEESEYFIQSIENNVNHFIIKPIDLDKLWHAIQKSIYCHQLEKEAERQKKLSRMIFDFQDQLIFIIKNDRIIEGNRAFSSVIGMEKLQGNKVKSLGELFGYDYNYFFPKNPDNWMEEFFTDCAGVAKVLWEGKDGKEYAYLMKAAAIADEEQYLFVCTDITVLENENKKNRLLLTLDPLTKVNNRLAIEDILISEIKRTERYGHLFSAILFDIDNFWQINEKFGHQIGDELLLTLSTIVQQRIRETDIFGRWGNEVFILITPEEDTKGASILAESIRKIIEEFNFPNIGYLTCSFGVAEFSAGKTKQQLLNELDAALGESKSKGENHVTIYHQTFAVKKEEGVSSA